MFRHDDNESCSLNGVVFDDDNDNDDDDDDNDDKQLYDSYH